MTIHHRDDQRISHVSRLLSPCLFALVGVAGLYAQAPLARGAAQPVSDLGQKVIHRLLLGKGFGVHPFGVQSFVRPLAITPDNWLGGAGNWNTATSWSTGAMPGSSNDAFINNSTPAAVVQLNVSDTINNLTLGTTSVLNFNNNTVLTIGGTTITNSNHTGTGGLLLSSIGNVTALILAAPSVTLTGGGTVTLSNNIQNYIFGSAAADVLTNANNTIQGSGNIGNGQMGLVNHGTIDANQPATLTIQTSNGTTNTGTLEATAGGNLILNGDTYTNTGGTILASGTGSVVTLSNPTINGGTLNTASGGLILATGNPTLNGVTNSGTYQLPNNSNTTLAGTITNSGGMQLNSVGNITALESSGAVTLTGAGTVTLSDNIQNYLSPAVAGSTLTNVNNTISGAGNIGNTSMGFINQSAGVVNAVSALGNALSVETGAAGATNLGLMEASSGGTLQLENAIANTNGTTNGTIKALSGGTVLLNGATVSGGTITTAGTGVVSAIGGSELDGLAHTVTSSGTLQVPNNNTLYMTGTLNNTGALSLNSAGNTTVLSVNSPTATLQGTGTVTLSDNNNNYITAATTGNQLTIAQTIQGAGGNIGNGGLVIVNHGTIDATASASGNVLTIQPDATVTNTGLLEATGGGTLALSGGTITNTGATITAASSSTVNLQGGVDIVGGTLNGAGTFVSSASSQLDGSAHTVTSAANLQIPNNSNLYIDGTINNTGTLSVNSAGNTTVLYVNSPTATLQGSGKVTFSDNNQNYIAAATTGNQLTNAQTIQGPGGNIGNGSLVIVNQGTIDATVSTGGNTLTIQPGTTLTNTGLLEATGGGSLALNGGTFTNTGGTVTAGSGSNVTLEGSVVVTGGTLNGPGLFTSLNGSTISGLTNAGTFQVPNNAGTTLVGTITNTGSMRLNGSGNNTFLYQSGAVTLTGGGTLTLSDNNSNYLSPAVGGSSLTNVNNTISGSGNIGNGNLAFTNQSGGVVDAVSASGQSLTINAGTPGAINAGLFEASSGGTLILLNSVNNTGGTIEGLAGTGANAGGAVVINGATVTGGTLNTLGTGVNASSMLAENGAILSGVTSSATILIPNNNNAELAGTVTNNGSIQENATGNNTFLFINGNTTLNGSGTIVLSNSSTNFVQGVAGTEILTNNGNTIEGSGNIGNGFLGVVNNIGGTILANQSTELFIRPSTNGFTNNGTVQVNTGSTLDITGGPFTNFNSGTSTLTGGTYNVNGGTLQFDNANIATNAANIILTGAGSQIVSDTSANALANFATNAAGGTFTLGAGRSFTTSGPGGNFANNGKLVVGGGDTFKVSGNLSNFAGTTLTGGTYYVAGTLQFGASGSHLNTNAASLTLAGTGAHLIDLGSNNLLSTFNTNANGAAFTVAAGGSFTTSGAFTNSGTLDLEQASSLTVAGNLTNNGTVATNNQNLQGGANTLTVTGTLANNAGDHLTVGANNDTSDVASVGLLTNLGTVTVDKGATLKLTAAGADSNTGSIALNGGTLNMQAGSLTNSGTIDLEQNATLTVTGNLTNSATITTNNQNLQGGANAVTVTGTLTNNTGDSVTIGANNDTSDVASVGLLTNLGTVTVDKGATLKLTAAGTDSNTGSIALNGGTLNMQAGSFTNSGTIDLEQKGTLTVTGNLTNSATITTNNQNLQGGANTVTVTGTLTNNTGDSVTIGANNDTSDVASVGLLSNAGTVTVDKGATLKLTATGADSNTGSMALSGGTLSIQAGTFTNSGTMDEEKGGKLSVTGGLTNSGTLSTNNSNQLGAANTISVSGKLTNNTGATMTIGANNDTADKGSVGALANSGTVTVGTGASLTLASATTDTNAGAIAVNGTLDIKSTTTLSGAGTLTLTNGAITGLGVGPALTNSTTIQGSGTISNLGLTNNKTLLANQAAPLIILPTAAGLNNLGTLGVSSGDTMQLGTSAGGALVNFAGNTLTGGIYSISGTLQFGASGTLLATNAANITLAGAGAHMIDFGNNNMLAGFNNNATAGVFKLASGASLATTGGSFTNAGLFTVSSGSSFTVGGSSFNFTQTAGTTTVDGGLTSTTLGTLNLNGGSLFGGGTLGYNVVDSGILSPGDSIAQSGRLTVADTYAQTSTGALDIAIGGATVGTKYDQLKVTQSATLGGTLNVSLANGFTPTVGQTFVIVSASSVSSTFAAVNGLAINGTEHFTITYNGTNVVLQVVSGALTTPAVQVTRAMHPGLMLPGTNRGFGIHGHDGVAMMSRTFFQSPMVRTAGATLTAPNRLGHTLSMSRPMGQLVPALAPVRLAIAGPITQAHGVGMRGLRPMDMVPAPVALAPASFADISAPGYGAVSPVSAAVYNSMGEMNHMRFECGVDLRAALKLTPKQLLKGLVSAPDSPNALAIGYMVYSGAH